MLLEKGWWNGWLTTEWLSFNLLSLTNSCSFNVWTHILHYPALLIKCKYMNYSPIIWVMKDITKLYKQTMTIVYNLICFNAATETTKMNPSCTAYEKLYNTKCAYSINACEVSGSLFRCFCYRRLLNHSSILFHLQRKKLHHFFAYS